MAGLVAPMSSIVAPPPGLEGFLGAARVVASAGAEVQPPQRCNAQQQSLRPQRKRQQPPKALRLDLDKTLASHLPAPPVGKKISEGAAKPNGGELRLADVLGAGVEGCAGRETVSLMDALAGCPQQQKQQKSRGGSDAQHPQPAARPIRLSDAFVPVKLTEALELQSPVKVSQAVPAIGVAQAPLRKLSLADALDSQEEKPKLASRRKATAPLADSTPATPCPAVGRQWSETGTDASTTLEDDEDAFIFSFTIRVAQGKTLGLQTSRLFEPDGKVAPCLVVDRVTPGGAADAWNKQCGSTGDVERVVLPGDRVVRVNGKGGDADVLLHECEARRMLTMMIVRRPAVIRSSDTSPAGTTATDASPLDSGISSFGLRLASAGL